MVFTQQEKEYERFSEENNSWLLMGKANLNKEDGIKLTFFYQINYEDNKYSYIINLLVVDYQGKNIPFSKLLEPESLPVSKSVANTITNSAYNDVAGLLKILKLYMEKQGSESDVEL